MSKKIKMLMVPIFTLVILVCASSLAGMSLAWFIDSSNSSKEAYVSVAEYSVTKVTSELMEEQLQTLSLDIDDIDTNSSEVCSYRVQIDLSSKANQGYCVVSITDVEEGVEIKKLYTDQIAEDSFEFYLSNVPKEKELKIEAEAFWGIAPSEENLALEDIFDFSKEVKSEASEMSSESSEASIESSEASTESSENSEASIESSEDSEASTESSEDSEASTESSEDSEASTESSEDSEASTESSESSEASTESSESSEVSTESSESSEASTDSSESSEDEENSESEEV